MPARSTLARSASFPLFADLDDAALNVVLKSAREQHAEAGEALITRWEGTRHFYTILSGEAAVRNDEETLRTLGPGDYFGELAALDWGAGFGYARTAHVVAVTPLRLLVLPASALHELLRHAPDIDGRLRATARRRLTQDVTMTARADPLPDAYPDQPTRSPWIAQLADDGPPRPLGEDAVRDVAVVGAGIAGVATAFFILRETPHNVLLIERNRVARGATGRNAGQMTTYFERPLSAIADEFGAERAVAAQRGFDTAHELFDLIVAETGATGRVERFQGHMGMFNLHHLEVHLRNNLIRRQCGWHTEGCLVSETAEFRERIPAEFDGLYDVVPQARVAELLEIGDDRYCAVLSDRKGCANSGLLAQHVLGHLERSHAGRFRFVDHTDVTRITVGGERVILRAGDHEVTAGPVVLCTNGFVDHAVVDRAGTPIRLAADQEITGRVAYMAAFAEDDTSCAGGDELHPKYHDRRGDRLRLRHSAHV